jgi:uncharacterized membrane protein
MPSWKQVTLLIIPWLLLTTTYLTYQLLERRFGKKICTGVILWTAIAHILIDFSALGWDVLFI